MLRTWGEVISGLKNPKKKGPDALDKSITDGRVWGCGWHGLDKLRRNG